MNCITNANVNGYALRTMRLDNIMGYKLQTWVSMRNRFLLNTILFFFCSNYLNAQDCTNDNSTYVNLNYGYSPSTNQYGADQWSFYPNECTSWVAYRLNGGNGIGIFKNKLDEIQNSDYNGYRQVHSENCQNCSQICDNDQCVYYLLGNAVTWGTPLQNSGYTVNNTPAKGAIMWRSSQGGHVAYVEKVWVTGDNRTHIDITEYNWLGGGRNGKESCGFGDSTYGESIQVPISDLTNEGFQFIHYTPGYGYDYNDTHLMPTELPSPNKPNVVTTMSNSQSTISWNYANNNAQSITLWKSETNQPGSFQQLGGERALIGNAIDATPNLGNSFYYEIQALPIDEDTYSASPWSSSGRAYGIGIPSNISYTVNDQTGTVDIDWDNVTSATSYIIERADNINFVNSETFETVNSSFSEVLGCGSYYYRIKSIYNSNGDLSESNYGNLNQQVTVNTPPAPPTSLQSEATGLNVTIMWSGEWQGGLCAPESFTIWRSTNGNSNYTQLETNIAQSPYIDVDVNYNNSYYYIVQPINNEGESVPISDERHLWYYSDVLATPTQLQASEVTSNSLVLTWEDNSTNETGFQIFRNESNIYTTNSNETSYEDVQLQGLTDYQYKVRAISGDIELYDKSNFSSIINVTTNCDVPPAAPTETLAQSTGNNGGREILIQWQDNTFDEDNFELIRYPENGSSDPVVLLAGPRNGTGLVNYTDVLADNLDLNQRYFYKVKVIKGECFNLSDFPDTYATTMEVPYDLNAVQLENGTGFNITWQGNTVGHEYYDLKRTETPESENSWISLNEQIPANSTSYQDNFSIQQGNIYYYKVRAYIEDQLNDYSGWTEMDQGVSVRVPEPPYNLTAILGEDDIVTLTWVDGSDNETGFILYRRLLSDEDWTTSWSISSTDGIGEEVSFVNTPGRGYTYQYGVIADNSIGQSEFSNIVEITLRNAPLAPTNFEGQTSEIEFANILTWNDNSEDVTQEDGFILQRRIVGSNSNWSETEFEISLDETTYVDIYDLEDGIEYEYRLYTYNDYATQIFCQQIVTITAVEVEEEASIEGIGKVSYQKGSKPSYRRAQAVSKVDVFDENTEFEWLLNGQFFAKKTGDPTIEIPFEDSDIEVIIKQFGNIIASVTEFLKLFEIDLDKYYFGGSGGGSSGGSSGGKNGGGFPKLCFGCKGWGFPVNKSQDPNDILGPEGYGPARWIPAKETIPYTIRFENDPELATVAALRVAITYPVPEELDIYSFRLGAFGFANEVFEVPEDKLYYTTRLDVTDSLGVMVDVTAGIDVVQREAFWILQAIDSLTGQVPQNAELGFLPVNDSIFHRGEGFVSFAINAVKDVQTADTVYAQASIVFDENEAIITPEIFNTLDADLPSSALDSVVQENDTTLVLYATGQDIGSGLQNYDLYVSENNGPYNLYTTMPPDSLVFPAEYDNSYAFYARARDNTEQMEPIKNVSEAAITTVDFGVQSLANATYCTKDILTVQWKAASSVSNLDIYLVSTDSTIIHSFGQSISASTGKLQIMFPEILPDTATYRIRITDPATQQSDTTAVFTIIDCTPESLLVLNPVANAIYCLGDTVQLTWQSAYIETLDLTISSDGQNFAPLTSGIDAASGSYAWIIAAGIASGTGQVLQLIDPKSNTIAQSSTFVLEDCTPMLTGLTLNAESYCIGETVNITWQSAWIETLDLGFSADGQHFTSLANNLDATVGSYSWTVIDQESGTENILRLTDPQSGSTMQSNVFAITDCPPPEPLLTVLHPQVGASYCVGDNLTIQWSSEHIEMVDILLSPDIGASYVPIAEGINAMDGSYDWEIPKTMNSGEGYRIKIGSDNLEHESGLFVINSCEITDLTNQLSPNFKIYPNPNRGRFTLEFPVQQQDVWITVKDLHDRVVWQKQFQAEHNNPTEIDISKHNAGMYLVDIILDGKIIWTGKVLHAK